MPGKTHYGRIGRDRYALAVFSLPQTGTTDQPEVFSIRARGAWSDLGDTGGCLAKIPPSLLHAWGLPAATC